MIEGKRTLASVLRSLQEAADTAVDAAAAGKPWSDNHLLEKARKYILAGRPAPEPTGSRGRGRLQSCPVDSARHLKEDVDLSRIGCGGANDEQVPSTARPPGECGKRAPRKLRPDPENIEGSRKVLSLLGGSPVTADVESGDQSQPPALRVSAKS